MKCIYAIVKTCGIGTKRKLRARMSVALLLVTLNLTFGASVNAVADQPFGGVSVDQEMWTRVEELAKTDDDARQAFERVDGKIFGAILRRGARLFAAYTTEKGDIVTRRFVDGDWGTPLSVTQDAPRRDGERWDMPRLIQGPDDVVWIAYRSQIRRRVFFHRWLGDMWGPRIDGRGIHHVNPAPSGEFNEDLRPIADVLIEGSRVRDTIEMRLTSTDEPPVTRVDSIDMVHAKAAPGESVLFIDARDVAQTEGLVWGSHSARKHVGNPLLSPRSDRDAPDAVRVFNRGTVLYEDGRFRMWYSATGLNSPINPDGPARNWQHYMRVCYAESEDGISWQRPDLGLVEFKGSQRNNIVPGILRCPTIYFDAHEPDPDRRYKCFGPVVPSVLRKEGHLSTSVDGLRWRSEPSPRSYPGVRPYWLPEFHSVFRDDRDPNPARRWKAYGLFATGLSRRSTHFSTSSDGIHWTFYAENPVIDQLQGVGHCIHDFIVWPEAGHYVGLIQVGDELHNYEWELVVSRDGLHFSRVTDGMKFIGRGEDGAWDSGGIQAASPIRVGDEWWFYYGGREKPWINYPADPKEIWTSKMHCGVATIGVGRYASFRLREGSEQGILLTQPIQCDFDRELTLSVNAVTNVRKSIRVAILDAKTGRPLDGYSLDDCVVNERDGVAIPIRWNDRTQVKLRRGHPVRIQFELHGSESQLYGFAWNKNL